jgi:hypothetical protein
MTQVMINGGCVGGSDHLQVWDKVKPDNDKIVIRRHMPVERSPIWATSDNIILALEDIGYEVSAIIINRDWYCIANSMVAHPGHSVYTPEEGYAMTQDCWHLIFEEMPRRIPFEIVSYESLVRQPTAVITNLYQRWGLDCVGDVSYVHDGNVKYYREAAVV